MKTVLFIAYNFPPAGGAGVQRSLKFIKYLPQFGWRPIVITTTPNAYPVRDDSLWADVPNDTPIYRVRSYDVNGLRPYATRLKLGTALSALNVALMLPDAAFAWARLARRTVGQVIQEHQPGLLYSSSGPASAHLLGKWAKKRFGVPWVADFRDPWSENRLVPYYPGYRALNRRMEAGVLTQADTIVAVSQPLVDSLQRLASPTELPLAVIENGYDEDDVTPLPPPRTARFTITYTGTFSRLRRPDAFIEAIERLLSAGSIPLERLRVVVAGKGTEHYIPQRPPFERLDYVSHPELADLRRQSNLLLLVQDPSPMNQGAYSGKLFEYLGSNRPILAISQPDNVAVELIARARAGIATRHDPAEIEAAIMQYYKEWSTERFDFMPDWDIIHQFTRRNLTARMAAEFDRLANMKPKL